ncbi:MAG TPA: hypothetical protein VK138_12910 [Acidiferrobacterales bacterium]|nr:hypothetical protein [Acidiferrobacterales bacterium]
MNEDAKLGNTNPDAGSSGTNPDSNLNNKNLRHIFVAFLFSLVAAEVARSAAVLFQIMEKGINIDQLAPAAHLFLAVLVVTTSWVGWSRSALRPDAAPLTNVFQETFLILLIDVLLVILYFTLARTVEIDSDNMAVREPSAFPEALLICVIFLIYLFWDVLYDVWMELGKLEKTGCRNFWTTDSLKKVLIFGAASMISLLCALLVLGIYTHHPRQHDIVPVYAADTALLAIVIGFRTLKGLEEPLAGCLKIEITPSMKIPFKWKRRLLLYGFAYAFSLSTLWLSA